MFSPRLCVSRNGCQCTIMFQTILCEPTQEESVKLRESWNFSSLTSCCTSQAADVCLKYFGNNQNWYALTFFKSSAGQFEKKRKFRLVKLTFEFVYEYSSYCKHQVLAHTHVWKQNRTPSNKMGKFCHLEERSYWWLIGNYWFLKKNNCNFS